MCKHYFQGWLMFLLLIIFCPLTILSQNNNDGLFIEANLLSSNDYIIEGNVISWDPFKKIISEKNDKKVAIGVSFGFSGKIKLAQNFIFNYRPGLTINNDYFSFLDFGIFVRTYIINNAFIGIGFISKLCITPREGNYNYSNPRRESFEYSICGGYDVNKRYLILFSFNDTLRDDYGQSYSNSNMNTKTIYKFVYWTMKIGIEYRF